MNNTSNNDNYSQDSDVQITSMALSPLSNPLSSRDEYWNLGTTSYGSAGFKSAWSLATGAGVTIGIVDEGVNYTHLDLVANYDCTIDFDPQDIGIDCDAIPDSADELHGTQVAGVIAGSAGNSFGTIGAAPDAMLSALYIRYGSGFSLADVDAIFTQIASFDVTNNSWGFVGAFSDNFAASYMDGIRTGIESAAATGRDGLGTAMVFAAGNGKVKIGGENIGDDSNFHNLSNNRFSIAVGAHDSRGEAAFFSSPGANILVSAPGVSLMTTTGNSVGSTEAQYVSGTSFAAPMVSAAVALMLEVNPNLGYRDIQEILAISSDPSLSGNGVANAASNINGGGLVFDREMGFGALNATAAVTLARSWTMQHTAANEEHINASFVVPDDADDLVQELTVDVVNPGTGDFSLDFVELNLDISDADLRDLRIELISPNGTVTLIAPNLRAAGNQTHLDFKFSSVATWGESPWGTWTVRLSHPNAASDFTITAASIDLYGDTTTADDDHNFTASYERLAAANAARLAITDTDGGTDRLNFAAAASGVTADLSGLGENRIGKAAFTLNGDFENVYGSLHADRFSGSDGVNIIVSDYGNDWIDGLGGDDTIEGGNGNDTLYGGAGADSLDGGAGNDVAAYRSAVTLDFVSGTHTGDAAGDLFLGIETFTFGEEDDFFFGSLAAVDDTVRGNGGSDSLDGGNGNDRLDGGTGNDTMLGGLGDDTFVVDSLGDVVVEVAGEGADKVIALRNYALGDGLEDLSLAGTARHGVGNGAGNDIAGNGYANKLQGLGGNDLLAGASGRDTLMGGEGRDTIVGGAGVDLMTGGLGKDVFVFTVRSQSSHTASDRITDFKHGTDDIDLSAIDANTKRAGNNAFAFIGTKDFTDRAGQLAYDHVGNKTVVLGDTDGNGVADFRIVLDGQLKLSAGDFIL
jgi:Ca2+-binding RTX toxin-like protein